MSKSPFTPTSGQIVSALDLVYYEIQQLAFLFHIRLLPLGVLNNARIEATLIHLRILLDFFEGEADERHKDDVLAADYGFPPKSLPIDEETRTRINKDLAHVRYERLKRTPAGKLWDFDQLLRPVLEHARAFIVHVLKDDTYVAHAKKREQWEELARLIDAVLARPSDKAVKGDRDGS